MTNMIHKSKEVKKARRRRYIDVVNHFRKKYNCTAAQVFGNFQGEISSYKSNIKELEEKIEKLNEVIKKKDEHAKAIGEANQKFFDEINELKATIELKEQNIIELVSKLDATEKEMKLPEA